MQSPLLRLSIDHMAYPGGGELFRNFALDVAAGQIVSVVGASGAGKTTLLRIIAGLETRFSGSQIFNGTVRTRPGPEIQIVFQDHRLLPWLRVAENVAFALDWNHEPKNRERVHQALMEVGMADKMRRWPWQLSGGEEQRVALARTLVRPPRLLLLDEPVRNLDILAAASLLHIIERIVGTHGLSVLLVSHDIEDAVALSDIVHVVAARPMKIIQTVSVNEPRPRDRASVEFAMRCAEVIGALRTAHHEPLGTNSPL